MPACTADLWRKKHVLHSRNLSRTYTPPPLLNVQCWLFTCSVIGTILGFFCCVRLWELCFHSNSNLLNVSVPAVINILNLMYSPHATSWGKKPMEAMIGRTKRITLWYFLYTLDLWSNVQCVWGGIGRHFCDQFCKFSHIGLVILHSAHVLYSSWHAGIQHNQRRTADTN